MAKIEKGLTVEEIGEQVEVEVKQPLQKIIPIRLSTEHWSELYRYAHELGIGPTTLARMWILERLAFLRAATSVSYIPKGILPEPGALLTTPQRLTFNKFIEILVSGLSDDVKQELLEAGKDSMMPSDAENLEDVKAILMSGKTVAEIGKVFYQAIARLMGVEIVEEEAETTGQKV